MEFYSKNKFEKLVHLVGFIIRIYYDARSPERQTQLTVAFRNFANSLTTPSSLGLFFVCADLRVGQYVTASCSAL